MSNFVKITVNVPLTHLDNVRLVIGDAGFGRPGNYDHAAFVTYGKGYFKALKGADPTIGEVGEIVEVDEAQLEFACQENEVDRAIEVIKSVHPYEEIALNVFPLLQKPSIYNDKRKR